MPEDPTSTKVMRDRFLAFAFASADVFLEITEEGTIVFALGAVKSITGEKGEDLEGTNWLNLFSIYEQARMLTLQEEAPNGIRCGPLLINMNHMKTDRKAVVSGIKMPYSRSFFLTISLSNELMESIAHANDEFDDSIYNQHQFIDAAEQVFSFTRTTNREADLTVIDVQRTESIPEEDWASLMGEAASALRGKAIDGRSVAELADGRLSFIHDRDIDVEALKTEITALVNEKYPESKDLQISSRTITTDTGELSAEDADKALYHTIKALANGDDLDPEVVSLTQSLKALVSENKSKMDQFKSYIETVNFKFNYQPVVRLSDYELTYYEMLCRFNDGDTKEWITFGEDAGLAPELDLAVCERMTNHLKNKMGGSRTMYSMNLSRQSISDSNFIEKFMERINQHKDLKERMIIEITGARKISVNDNMKNFIKALRKLEFKVALDGLTADSRSIDILNALECDYVKLHRKYSGSLPGSQHTQALVGNLAKLCLEKGIKAVAKHIETKEQAELFKSLNIELGQGFYFGKAEAQAAYAPPKDKAKD